MRVALHEDLFLRLGRGTLFPGVPRWLLPGRENRGRNQGEHTVAAKSQLSEELGHPSSAQ